MNYALLIDSWKTVFTIQDLLLLFSTQYPQTIRNFLQRMKKKWIMHQLQYGIRGLQSYNVYELASKLKKNSYISCETILKETWVIFQYYGNTIMCVSDNTLTKKVDGKTFVYKKITERIRLEPAGIIQTSTYAKATTERALCDCIYLSPDLQFDDLTSINHEVVIQLAQHYPKRVLSRLHTLFHDR